MATKVKNNLMQFVRNNADIMDKAMGTMAQDVVIISRTRVPFKSGDLFKHITAKKLGRLRHRVVADTEYAAYQERGRRLDGSHVVRRYSTPNTGAHFIQGAAETVVRDAVNYLKQAARRVRV